MLDFQSLRKAKGFTQLLLSEKTGLRQASISAIERGQVRPHAATRKRLAKALKVSLDKVEEALAGSLHRSEKQKIPAAADWEFLRSLDGDLREGLAQSLISDWTHHSTSLEGNTISAGDTLFILNEGLTISGKSLREHQEIHGHAQALSLLSTWLSHPTFIKLSDLHALHQAVQAGAVVDVFSPIGAWKVENNGTMVITTSGERVWHDYSRHHHIPQLMKDWLNLFQKIIRQRPMEKNELVEAFTDVHLSFTAIHPYADGNGRLARLLANLPLLLAGEPPLIIQSSERKAYITLLGDYTLKRGLVSPDDHELVLAGHEKQQLRTFFKEQWQPTQDLVAAFHERQKERRA